MAEILYRPLITVIAVIFNLKKDIIIKFNRQRSQMHFNPKTFKTNQVNCLSNLQPAKNVFSLTPKSEIKVSTIHLKHPWLMCVSSSGSFKTDFLLTTHFDNDHHKIKEMLSELAYRKNKKFPASRNRKSISTFVFTSSVAGRIKQAVLPCEG